MDYEKKYQRVLKSIRVLYNQMKYLSSPEALAITVTLEDNFPELKESPDEGIREEIINYLKSFIPHHDDELVMKSRSWIAWLEKQGEKNPAWSEEDKLMIQDAIHWIQEFQKSDRCKDENDMQNSVTCENWLKSIIGI